MQDVSFTGRLLMEKTFGSQDDSAITNGGAAPFFADRVGVFDGTLGHVPSNSLAAVDRAYGTWSNIARPRHVVLRRPAPDHRRRVQPPAGQQSPRPAPAACPRCWSTTPSTA